MTCDVAIIGAGIIGLSCAWRLRQAGLSVRIFERDTPGRGASWAAAGMLAPQSEAALHPPASEAAGAMFDLSLRSREMYAGYVEELAGEVGLRWGAFFVPGSHQRALQSLGKQVERGLRVEDATATGLWPEPGQAFWLPDEGRVDNRKLTTLLHRRAEEVGVVVQQSRVLAPTFEGTRVTGVRTADETFAAGAVLVCAGAWSNPEHWRHDYQVDEMHDWPHPFSIPMVPVGGQMVQIANPPLPKMGFKPMWSEMIYSPGVYIVPRGNTLLLGATVEPGVLEPKVTVQGMRQLLNNASQMLPQLETVDPAILDSWAGTRPGTPDGLPILGKTPFEELFVATGHGRDGILLAPVTAHLMTQCILRGKEPPEAFRLSRFLDER